MIDLSSLPNKVFLDTSVVVPALQRRNPCATCLALWNQLIAERRHVFISVITITELLRGTEATEVPRVKSIQVVPYDYEASVACAKHFSSAVIKASRTNNVPHNYYKFDTLIAASAVRYADGNLVTLDDGHGALAARTSRGILTPHKPADFLVPQQLLPL